jgi:hypothetical protein
MNRKAAWLRHALDLAANLLQRGANQQTAEAFIRHRQVVGIRVTEGAMLAG